MATDLRHGAGHLTRCRALAKALRDPVALFVDPSLLPAFHADWAHSVVVEESYQVADKAIGALINERVDALIIDSYAIDDNAINKASAAGFTVVFRDGTLSAGEHLTINPNPDAIGASSVLAGPSYFPLSDIFLTPRSDALEKLATQKNLNSVLVAFGARDSANLTNIALQGIALLDRQPVVKIAMGSGAEHSDAVQRLSRDKPWAHIITDCNDMPALYGQSDLAIGAPGVSQFERAFSGLASILVPQNHRQQQLADSWAAKGAAVCCAANPGAIATEISFLSRSPSQVELIRRAGLSLVDGRGALRLADRLEQVVGIKR